MSRILVSIALFTDAQNRFLITQRGVNSSFSGWWEFPGGKVEANETPDEALRREVYEELGVVVHEAHYCGEIEHNYPESSVCLRGYRIVTFSGIPACCEQQQDLRWVSRTQIAEYLLLDASRVLLAFLDNKIDAACQH